MPKPTAARTYGKAAKRIKPKAERLFAELPQSPFRVNRKQPLASETIDDDENVGDLTKHLDSINLQEEEKPRPRRSPRKSIKPSRLGNPPTPEHDHLGEPEPDLPQEPDTEVPRKEIYEKEKVPISPAPRYQTPTKAPVTPTPKTPEPTTADESLILTWEDVCPSGDQIAKIAEASYSEVYRVTNSRGVSIIKVIRLPSPIRPLTKAQIRARQVDEQPHTKDDVLGELQISEWLADIPGFVVYKQRYIVQGKATKELLETHQVYQRRLKRRDPGRAQFYPSPSRYTDETQFMVVELGDAGKALEDWKLESASQLWDIFFLEAIALARAEDLVMFEHRDLHEGNLCLRQAREPTSRPLDAQGGFFGHSGLDITILDYGLSRAEDLEIDFAKPVAYDLERDLSMFTSTYAPQCQVYRQMRSFLLRGDRTCLPPEAHDTPYPDGIDGKLSWEAWAPYTNVLWLAYLYNYLVTHFKGDKKELVAFREETKELWRYLDPEAEEDLPCFNCAGDVVCFGVESGWLSEEQLMDRGASMIERDEQSIFISRVELDDGEDEEEVTDRRLQRRGQK